MIEYIDDYNKKTIWDVYPVKERVHVAIRKESRTIYEALSLEAAKELLEELNNAINLIEEKK